MNDPITARDSVVTPPEMFNRPAEAPDPPLPISSGDEMTTVHKEWERLHTDQPLIEVSPIGRIRRRKDSLISRARGHADHDFLADLIRALAAVATRCDEIADRMARQEIIAEDTTRIFGEELTSLRAEMARLSALQGNEPPIAPSS
jgi:hypothetical protein